MKPKILDLIEDYYLPLEINLMPCISGLINSILPGIEEKQDLIRKRVLNTLDHAMKNVGRKFLMGAIWMVEFIIYLNLFY